MKIYLQNWYKQLLSELPNTRKLRIISPFVKEQVLRKLQSQFEFRNFELITRFNLQDFKMGMSTLAGLKFSVENRASVYGIKGLHSKVYLFDKRVAIVTSANLTNGGLKSNYECGIFLTDSTVIANLHKYFDDLKQIARIRLTSEKCDEWERELAKIEIHKGKEIILPDHGASAEKFNATRSYFIKFFGTSNNRVELDYSVRKEIDRALCHYACGFSKKRRPREINDGDIIFMARMTKRPDDYAIFGKAIAIKHTEGRDEASKKEIKERGWKQRWPIYLRVKETSFIDGTMADCILLSDLISKFDYNSFPSTKKRFDDGEKNIKPTKSLMRKAYVRLTHDAAEWLEQEFNETAGNIGKVNDTYLKGLPQTTTDVVGWKS